jgi:hypothetical protein
MFPHKGFCARNPQCYRSRTDEISNDQLLAMMFVQHKVELDANMFLAS